MGIVLSLIDHEAYSHWPQLAHDSYLRTAGSLPYSYCRQTLWATCPLPCLGVVRPLFDGLRLHFFGMKLSTRILGLHCHDSGHA